MAAIRYIVYRTIGCHRIAFFLLPLMFSVVSAGWSQEKLTLSYAALGGANLIWNIAKDVGFYKKHGLDAEVVYIGAQR